MIDHPNDDRNPEPTPTPDEQAVQRPPVHGPRVFERTGRGRWRLATAGAVLLLIIILIAVLFAWRRRNMPRSVMPPTGMTIPSTNGRTTAAAGGEMQDMRMSSGGTIQLTANDLRAFGVTFGTVEERTLTDAVRTVGTVAVDETTLAQVTPRFDGYVERLYVNETGQRVHRGEPLMDVYAPALVAAQQELLVAGQLERSIGTSAVPGVPAPSTDLVSAARRRLELWGISDAQIDAILRSGEVRRTLTLYAPASGVVVEKHVAQGQAIHAGEMLYTIANLSDVWIDVALREQDAGAVRTGSRATIELTAYPGQSRTGRIGYVYPTLDSSARTVRARIEVPNRDGRLKPGMYATVTLDTPTRRALTVPTSAVLNTGDRTLVFMDMGEGRLMPMDIVTGRTSGAYTEVLSGLEPAQRVVTSAQYLLDSESNLAEVMKSMIGQGISSDMRSMPGMNDTGADMKGMKGMPMPSSPTTPRR